MSTSRGAVLSAAAPNKLRFGSGGARVAEFQRARLLAGMTDAACERGAGNVTVADVVERAGVSRRTFYELFGDREECLLAAFDDVAARLSETLTRAVGRESVWERRVRVALVALLSFADTDRPAARLLFVESSAAGVNGLERRARIADCAIAAVEAGRRDGAAMDGDGPARLVAEGAVGAVLAIVHDRLLDPDCPALTPLANELTSMVVLPFRGPAAARRELKCPPPPAPVRPAEGSRDAPDYAGLRLTYRTALVLAAVAERPGASNSAVGESAGISDQGQTSKLLARLQRLGLTHNETCGDGRARARGTPNSWVLTPEGERVARSVGVESAVGRGVR